MEKEYTGLKISKSSRQAASECNISSMRLEIVIGTLVIQEMLTISSLESGALIRTIEASFR